MSVVLKNTAIHQVEGFTPRRPHEPFPFVHACTPFTAAPRCRRCAPRQTAGTHGAVDAETSRRIRRHETRLFFREYHGAAAL